MRTIAVFSALAIAVGGHLVAQAPERLAFEVASIKVNKSGTTRTRRSAEPGGRYTLTNITAEAMLQGAFELGESQIVDAPSWTREDRFDVLAKLPEGSFDAQTGATHEAPMLKALLEERFNLKVHQETRDLLEGALVLARADGKLGPKLTPASVEDTTCPPKDLVSSAPNSTDPYQNVAPCGILTGPSANPGKRRMKLRGATLDLLAVGLRGLDMLATVPNVLNETGLSGAFNVDLEWEPLPPSGVPDATAEGPLLSTALADQLGLKVVTRKTQTAVIIIDHIEHPTEN